MNYTLVEIDARGDDPVFQSASALLEFYDLPIEDLVSSGVKLFGLFDGEIFVGCGGFEDLEDAVLLRSVAISEDYRGKGLGKKITQLVIDKVPPGKDIYLLTTTAEDFFKGMGFSSINREQVPQSVRETAEFSSICPASSAVMCLSR